MEPAQAECDSFRIIEAAQIWRSLLSPPSSAAFDSVVSTDHPRILGKVDETTFSARRDRTSKHRLHNVATDAP